MAYFFNFPLVVPSPTFLKGEGWAKGDLDLVMEVFFIMISMSFRLNICYVHKL